MITSNGNADGDASFSNILSSLGGVQDLGRQITLDRRLGTK